MKHKRRALVAIHETAVDQYVDIKRNEAIGQDSLFGGMDDEVGVAFGVSVSVPDIEDWDKMTLLGPRARDARALRLRPPARWASSMSSRRAPTRPSASSSSTRSVPTGPRSPSAGLVTSVQRKINKRGDTWAIVTLEDLAGAIDVRFFASSYQLASTYLTEDAILTVKGTCSARTTRPR